MAFASLGGAAIGLVVVSMASKERRAKSSKGLHDLKDGGCLRQVEAALSVTAAGTQDAREVSQVFGGRVESIECYSLLKYS
jgi:hypothetical protein